MKLAGGQRLTQKVGGAAKQIRRSLLRAIDAHCAAERVAKPAQQPQEAA